MNTRNSCSRPLSVFIKSMCKSTVFNEFSSFQTIPLIRSRRVTHFYEHPHLNRFIEVPCYNSTRVKVKHSEGHNYINASYVDGFREASKFIVTQTPMPNTIDQFWLMVWEQKSPIIVALHKLTDDNNNPILPQKSGNTMKHGDIWIETLHCRLVRNSYEAAVLKINHVKETNLSPRKLLVLTFHSWGVKGTPKKPTDFLDLIADMNYNRNLLREFAVVDGFIKAEDRFPITLTCHSGFGRGCVLAAIDVLCRRLEASAEAGTPFVDVLDTIVRLRMQRAGACPKSEHFLFVSFSLLEYAVRAKLIPENMVNDINLDRYVHSIQQIDYE